MRPLSSVRSTVCDSPLSHCMPTIHLTYHRRAKFCGIIVLNFAWDKRQMETMVVQNSFGGRHINSFCAISSAKEKRSFFQLKRANRRNVQLDQG